MERTHAFKKGMIINCTLEKVDVNPPQVKYTWYSCGTSKCNEKNAKLKSDSYSLELDSQSKSPMNYRCKAENAAGSDYQDIEVIGQSESESKIIRRITTARILYTHIWQYSKTFFYMPISINDDCHNDLEICGGGGGGRLTYHIVIDILNLFNLVLLLFGI